MLVLRFVALLELARKVLKVLLQTVDHEAFNLFLSKSCWAQVLIIFKKKLLTKDHVHIQDCLQDHVSIHVQDHSHNPVPVHHPCLRKIQHFTLNPIPILILDIHHILILILSINIHHILIPILDIHHSLIHTYLVLHSHLQNLISLTILQHLVDL